MKKFVSNILDWVRDRVQKNPRVFVVLCLAVFELFCVYLVWRFSDDLGGLGQFVSRLARNTTVAAALFSAPVAFLIWAFRNHDKQKDIETAEKQNDIKEKELDLKTFTQFQQWACDTENPDLQVVAINQLCPYVLGEHGESFKRPTFILLKTLWFNLVKKQVEKWDDRFDLKAAQNWREELRKITNTPLGESINYALLQKKGQVFRDHEKELSRACFAGLNFNLPNLDQPIDLSGLNMKGIILCGSYMRSVSLEDSDLSWANLSAAKFENCKMNNTNLDQTDLIYPHFVGIDFSRAKLPIWFYDLENYCFPACKGHKKDQQPQP
jgi:uncharacterized protein YjbI with pentapeptide repeats